MKKTRWERTMVETILRRALDEIQENPKRAVRKLVDLGMETSGGDLQKSFMGTAQQMLLNEKSPYYDLVLNTIKWVDRERILTFGINLGWNSLTEGAARIRELEARQGHNIPWSMTFHMADGPDTLTGGDYIRLVLEGMELGICSYFLMPEDAASVQNALNLAAACRDCAFFLWVPEGYDWEGGWSGLTLHRNLILGVDYGEAGWEKRAGRLRAEKCLYFLYRRYSSEEDTAQITSGAWMEQALPHAGVAVAFIGAEGQAAGLSRHPVYQYALDARMGQRYPTLVADFYPDNLYLDVRISRDPCFAGLLPDGTLTDYRQGRETPTGLSARRAPLEDLLKHFSKAGAAV